MLTDDKLREIRESVDLVALISEYVPLRRQGARFLGLCPFHQEKTPSFGVSRGKNFYYCFGCQASGDAITFLRHVEGLGFMEAVERLAERAGIEVPRTDDVGQLALRRARARRESLAEVMGLAVQFFEQQLETHPHADFARAELARRKVLPETRAAFQLGYAPAGWDGLSRFLAEKRVELDDAVEVGLIAPRNAPSGRSGHYDRFRHRLMFPVADQHGRVIAFSGRALPAPPGAAENEPPAKYINSPEGPLYKKGQALFGLSTGKVALRKQNQAILCEGNFDLVAIYQAGFAHVVAPLGTAFTLEQARLLRRFVEEVVVMFDGDAAGRKATASAHDLLQTAGLKGRAVRLPPGQDPDSFLGERGPEDFAALVQAATPILEFLIDEAAVRGRDTASRAREIQQLAPLLVKVESPLERTLYVERIAKKFDIRDLASVRAELRRGLQTAGHDARRHRDGKQGGSPTSGSDCPTPVVIMRKPSELPARQLLVLGALLDHPPLFQKPEASRLAGLLTDSDLRAIFLVTARMLEQRGEVDALALLDELAGNAARAWLGDRLSAPEFEPERAEEVFSNGLPLLERNLKEGQRAEIKREIQLAKLSGDRARVDELERRRNELYST